MLDIGLGFGRSLNIEVENFYVIREKASYNWIDFLSQIEQEIQNIAILE